MANVKCQFLYIDSTPCNKETSGYKFCTEHTYDLRYSASDLNDTVELMRRIVIRLVQTSAHDSRCASLADQSHINVDLCDCSNHLLVDSINTIQLVEVIRQRQENKARKHA